MSLFNNFFLRKTPYDLESMATILEASYSKEISKDEEVTKTGFAPSSLGYGAGICPRRWFLMFNGAHVKDDVSTQSVDNMQHGTDRHERLQHNFTLSGLDIEVEKELWHEDPPIHCYVDLIVKDFNGFDIPIEIKTTRFESFAHKKAKNKGADYQELQLLIYLYLLDLQYGLLLYEDKNSFEKLLIPVELDEENKKRVESVFEWMRTVYKAYKDEQLPEKPFRANSKVCKVCPIKEYCFDQPKGDIVIAPLDYSEGTNVN